MAFPNLFGNKNQQQQNTNQQQQNQQQQGNQQGNQQQNQQQQNGNQQQTNSGIMDKGEHGNPNEAKNPLDAFTSMFQNTDNGEQNTVPKFDLPKDKLEATAKSMDFLQGLDQELLQKAMTGDAASFLEVIQHASRSSYQSALDHGSKLSDQFINQRLSFDEKGFASKVNSQLTQQELSTTANFNHPVVKQQLTEVAQRLAKANPDAAPADIARMAKEYVVEMANAINGTSAEDAAKKDKEKSGEVDWTSYFN